MKRRQSKLRDVTAKWAESFFPQDKHLNRFYSSSLTLLAISPGCISCRHGRKLDLDLWRRANLVSSCGNTYGSNPYNLFICLSLSFTPCLFLQIRYTVWFPSRNHRTAFLTYSRLCLHFDYFPQSRRHWSHGMINTACMESFQLFAVIRNVSKRPN